MRHWKYVSGFCGWLKESVYLSLLWDEVTRVHCFCLQSECCTALLEILCAADSLLWLSVLKSCCATPPWFLQPKKKNKKKPSRHDRRCQNLSPWKQCSKVLSVNPHCDYIQSDFRKSFTLKRGAGTSVWTWLCLGLCECVFMWFGGTGSQKVTHHAPLGALRCRAAEIWLFLILLYLYPTSINVLSSSVTRVAPWSSTILPWGTQCWGTAQSRFLWCLTLCFKVISMKAGDLGSDPGAAQNPASLSQRVRQDRDAFPLVSSSLNKANFFTEGHDKTKFHKWHLTSQEMKLKAKYFPHEKCRNEVTQK